MTRDMDAGVTLIEMLVVLAVFAVVAGAVILSVPGDRGQTPTRIAALSLAAHLERAIDLTLSTGAGFGIENDQGSLRFVQMDDEENWGPHSDKRLVQVKLSTSPSRISITAQEVFVVSARLIPSVSAPLRVEFGDGRTAQAVVFDGVRVQHEDGGS